MTTPGAMPTFTIKGKDALAVEAVEAYRDLCVKHSLTAQADQVDLAIAEIVAWQGANPLAISLPDHTHVPVEPDSIDVEAKSLIRRAFGLLGRMNVLAGADMRWRIHVDDLQMLRTFAGTIAAPKPLIEVDGRYAEPPGPDREFLIGVEIDGRYDVPRGSLMLVVGV